MRLGIFGGSFDPVHYGHLLLAETCREECALDEVWFIPAASPPHKQQRTMTPGTQRLEMLELAVAGHNAFVVSDLEINRGGVSYTVDTLSAITEQHPGAELFFLMGADSLHDLPTWREPQQICKLALPLVVRRAGTAEPSFDAVAALVGPERLDEVKKLQVSMPLIELSSTDIRQRVAANKSIRFRTPRAVEKYIETQRLYAG